jgi:hypothetical protein
MSRNSLERRVAALEAEIARLKARQGPAAATTTAWWEQVAGVFAGDASFDQAMRLGSQYRRSLGRKPLSPRKRSRNGHPRH